jgi:hypothetical protein
MQITISERLRPYSHKPGTRCVLPGTTLSFEIFPTLIHVSDKEEYSLPLVGPIKDFTIHLDLEKACITVTGFDSSGYFCYDILPTEKNWKLVVKKSENKKFTSINESEQRKVLTKSLERLSLGNHKAQDWELVQRRLDPTEIFPVWHKAGQYQQSTAEHFIESTEELLQLFSVGFEGILSPTTSDKLHMGISVATQLGFNTLSLGSQSIRNLFVKEGKQVEILRHLPKEFHCGRFLGISLSNGLFIDLEWTKKIIRRMIIYGKGETSLQFQKEIKRFRLRRNTSDRGAVTDTDRMITVDQGERYLLDRFE